MITIRNLQKRRDERAILSGADADIGEGEAVAIVGASGGGKTTLLRCLNALETYDEGELSIAGHRLMPRGRGLTPHLLGQLRTSVGMVFQEFHLFPHLTALENVSLGPRVVGRQPPEEAARRARDLLSRVGLGAQAELHPHQLSGGQKQRVALARALASEPRVLLLDEPTSALDPATAEGVADTVRSLTRGRITVVLVTHHIDVARRMTDRVLRLEGGVLSAVPRSP